MNYINKEQIEKVLFNSCIKVDKFLEGLKKHEVNGKTVYSYEDVQRRYNKMTTEYYQNKVNSF